MPIQITTSNSFENSKILKYYTPITASVVVGTNIFGDISASISDLFGGRSESYEKRLKSIYLQALNNIEQQSLKIGSNGIIGLKIDYNEISGKGMQMFMVTITGTPVMLNLISDEVNADSISMINGELIELKIKAKRLIDSNNGQNIQNFSSTSLTIISNSALPDYLQIVVPWLNELNFSSNHVEEQNRIEAIIKYLENIPLDDFKSAIYQHLFTSNSKNSKHISKLVEKRDAIDYNLINDHLRQLGGSSVDLLLLNSKKSFYDAKDLTLLNDIIDKFDNYFPILSQEREEISKGLFSKDVVKVWDCSCGKKVSGKRCGHCDKDVFGYTSDTPYVPIVKKYLVDKVSVLEEILLKQN